MEKIKILAGIVTYNPNILRLKQNIEAVYKQVTQIIILDNSSTSIEVLKESVKYNKIEWICMNENMGIAFALNKIMEYAKANKYSWVLTLDQDSIVADNMVKELSSYISDNVGIICPYIADLNKKNELYIDNGIKSVEKCITSGSLTSVKAWEDVGKFDDYMFIDGVDFDFCIRLRNNGYSILQNSHIIMKHEIGKICQKKFAWRTLNVKNHSSFRKYYIVRNIIYLDKKHHLKGYPVTTFMRIFKQLIFVWLFEEKKKEKTSRIIRGIIDGFRVK